MKRHLIALHKRLRPHWRKILIFGGGGLLFIFLIGQVLFPSDRLVPFTVIDGLSLGGFKKDDAIEQIDKAYLDKEIPLYFGSAKEAYRSPKSIEFGLTASNETRINNIDYPWYIRVIPTSILWMHFINQTKGSIDYQRDSNTLDEYIAKELGDSCNVESRNASLRLSGDDLEVVPSHNGGTCEISTVKQVLSDIQPQINNDIRVTIPMKETASTVNDEMAGKLGEDLHDKIGNGVLLMVNSASQLIARGEILSWIDFSVVDEKLSYSFNEERASVYLNKEVSPKLAVSAGTTTINTHDFVEVARVNGTNGKKLDIGTTLNNIKLFLDGNVQQAVSATSLVSPKMIFNRTYSSTDVGLSALMQQYSQDHPGIYGVSLIELSGSNRRASYNDTSSFTTASTYKLFVAYSTLKRVEEGLWHWNDSIVDTRDLSTCFDDMIVKSDNTCAAALLHKVGYSELTNEARALGCTSTSFLGSDGIKTAPADLSLFLAELQTGQMLTQQSSRDRLINAMKRNVYRQGIPAGVGGVVADKVGFLYGLLHDASIVYSPTGTYVLVIMTDGSSWATIADFTSKIEALRIQ